MSDLNFSDFTAFHRKHQLPEPLASERKPSTDLFHILDSRNTVDSVVLFHRRTLIFQIHPLRSCGYAQISDAAFRFCGFFNLFAQKQFQLIFRVVPTVR